MRRYTNLSVSPNAISGIERAASHTLFAVQDPLGVEHGIGGLIANPADVAIELADDTRCRQSIQSLTQQTLVIFPGVCLGKGSGFELRKSPLELQSVPRPEIGFCLAQGSVKRVCTTPVDDGRRVGAKPACR
jgi:hypothetical protein